MTIWTELNQKLQILRSESTPQIILDIDDTLIDCRHRKHQVFMDFLEQVNIAARYPKESSSLRALNWQSVCYKIDDNLKRAGIDNLEFAQELFYFWRAHYFTYHYLIQDQPFPGAVSFVNKCRAMGLKIVYLTGRDIPGMERGTREQMDKLGFPTTGPDIFFYLKPDVLQDDFNFKLSALEMIAGNGPVLAALENELSNLNAMAEKFENALAYWRPTLYSPNPPQPHPRVKVLEHFPED